MKKNIVFICGVPIDHTPVVKNAITYLNKNNNCIVVTYNHGRILSFLFNSIVTIVKTKNLSAVYFIQIQALPILFLFQLFSFKKYYWALESMKFKFFKGSLVEKIIFFEYLIIWKRILLIVPSQYRLNFFEKIKCNKSFIIENTSMIGNSFIERSLKYDKIIKFVIYGRLNNEDIYLKEFIEIASKFSSQMELHIIGWDFELEKEISISQNIYYHGRKSHLELLSLLDEFHVSVIGYRPYNFNNKFCAPNKLYESFSLSLPVLANNQNPSLCEIMKDNSFGLLADFNKLQQDFSTIIENFQSNYAVYNDNTYNAYVNKYNFEAYFAKITDYQEAI